MQIPPINGRKQKEQVSYCKLKEHNKNMQKTGMSPYGSKSSGISSGSYSVPKKKNIKNEHLKQNILTPKSRLTAGKITISSASILMAKINFSKVKSKDQQNIVKFQEALKAKEKKKEQKLINDSEKDLISQLPYFIECMNKKHRLFKQMHLNIHNSIFTFKEFLKACQNAKAKTPLSNMASEKSERKTLVFDMDETLIHTNQRITNNFEIRVPFRSYQGKIGYGYVTVRPYAKELLEKLHKHFDIMIFTASSQAYADPILNHIDPNKTIQHRLYRQHCTLVRNQIFVKDLRIINRKIENVVLIDNAPHSYMMQLENGIPILPYYKGSDDQQLQKLQQYLMQLKDVEDVRVKNREHFRLHDYTKYDNYEKALSGIYSRWFREAK